MTNQEKLEKYNANATKITVLKNKIANIESCEEILSTEVGTNGLKAKKYKTQYPFFKRTAGASGYVDTGSFYGYISLEQKSITGSNPQYPVIRTLVPRTYTNASGSLVTTIPNGSSATNAVYNWAQGEKGYTLVAQEYLNNRTIAEGVREQDDYYTKIGQTYHNQADFADLLDCDFLAPPAIEALEILKAELITQFNAELETLSAENVAILADINALKSAAQVALAQSQATLKEKEDALKNLEQTNAATLTEITTLQEEIARLEAELENLNNANPEYAANLQELENLRNQKTTLESQIADFLNDITLKEAELESVRSEVSTKEQEFQDLQNQSTQLESELNALNIQKQGLQTQIQNTQDSIAENSAKKPVLESEITQLQEDLNNQNTLSTELQAQITELEQQKAQLESQLATLADPELLARRDQLNADITNLQTQIQNAQNNIQGLEAEIATLETQKTELESALQEANTQLIQLQAQKTELESQITPKEQELQNLQSQITEAQSELDTLRAQNSELESNLAQKRAELQELKDAVANYDVNTLNSELQVLLTQIPQKQQELTELQALLEQNQGNKEVLAELEAQIAEKQAELDSYADSEIYKAQQTLEALKKKLEAILNTNSFVLESDLKDLHTRAINLAKTLKIEICQNQSSVEYIPQSDKPKNFVGFMYRAKDGERLDSIVYAHYGTLNLFQSVLACNPNLLNHRILRAGEIVWLPSADTKAKSLENKLWS